jgi:NADH dehydrogenase [ubiquinone] 1 alpha subcomplex assembly factor 7
VSQGDWLQRLGIDSRAQALSRANPDRLHDLNAAIQRLCGAKEMGTLFKVIAVHSLDWPQPAGFA